VVKPRREIWDRNGARMRDEKVMQFWNHLNKMPHRRTKSRRKNVCVLNKKKGGRIRIEFNWHRIGLGGGVL
jgi:murein L,D-transpeptidase YafK